MGTAEVVRTHAAQDTHCGRLAAASTPQNRSILYPKLCHFLLHFRFPSLYFPLLHIVWIEVDLKKNLAKELAGPKVVNDDLKFLTKEMGIFEGTKEKSECLQKLYNALMNISLSSVSCKRVFSMAGGVASFLLGGDI